MAEISGKSSTQAVPVCNGISSASQNTGFWSACLNVLVMPLLTSDTTQGFCSFWARTELLMQPSSPQDLDRREELSFWARVTIHGQSSVRGLQEKATTEASLLLRESWVLFSLLDFFNKLLLFKCIFKEEKNINHPPEEKNSWVLQRHANCCCVLCASGGTELTYERRDKQKGFAEILVEN